MSVGLALIQATIDASVSSSFASDCAAAFGFLFPPLGAAALLSGSASRGRFRVSLPLGAAAAATGDALRAFSDSFCVGFTAAHVVPAWAVAFTGDARPGAVPGVLAACAMPLPVRSIGSPELGTLSFLVPVKAASLVRGS